MSKALTNKNRNNISCNRTVEAAGRLSHYAGKLSHSGRLSHYTGSMQIHGQNVSNLTSNISNLYHCNGKELQNQTNYYDYGFRQYDPQLGRWHVIDAMAEKYFSQSPYNYVGNNPVSRADFMGLTYHYKEIQWQQETRLGGGGGGGNGYRWNAALGYRYGGGSMYFDSEGNFVSFTQVMADLRSFGLINTIYTSSGGVVGGHFETYSAISISHVGWGVKSAGRLGIRGLFHRAFHNWKIETHLFSRWVADDAGWEDNPYGLEEVTRKTLEYRDKNGGRWSYAMPYENEYIEESSGNGGYYKDKRYYWCSDCMTDNGKKGRYILQTKYRQEITYHTRNRLYSNKVVLSNNAINTIQKIFSPPNKQIYFHEINIYFHIDGMSKSALNIYDQLREIFPNVKEPVKIEKFIHNGDAFNSIGVTLIYLTL